MFGDLNDAQRAAVTHGEGPLLIVAGAGTGKTTTLASRVAWLRRRRACDPSACCCSRSAGAPRARCSRGPSASPASRTCPASTPRASGAARSTRSPTACCGCTAAPLGLRPDFTVLDQADAADVMNLLRDELGFSARERRFPRKETLAGIYSRTVNAGETLGDVLKRHYPWCLDEVDGIREIFAGVHRAQARAAHVLDYDDLLLFWKALVTERRHSRSAVGDVRPRARRRVPGHERAAGRHPRGAPARRHRRATSRSSATTRRRSTGSARRPCATSSSSPTRFPGATIVKLEQNYRSTPPILDASNAVIALSPQRHEKTLWSTRRGDACADAAHVPRRGRAVRRGLPRRVLAHREEGVPLKEQAVLFRAAHHSDHARGRAHPAQHPVREVRRPEVHGGRPREGHARDPARAREPVRRGERGSGCCSCPTGWVRRPRAG